MGFTSLQSSAPGFQSRVAGMFAGNPVRIERRSRGNELNCVARIEGKTDRARALLVTSELSFRGADGLVEIRFADMKGVESQDEELRIKTKDGVFGFALGRAAEKWREKILHPKTRIEKLGVRAGIGVEV